MSENKQKFSTPPQRSQSVSPILTNLPPQTQQPRTPEETNLLLAQAIGNLNQRMSNVEIEATKGNANIEILSNRIELLKKTIDLLEKEMKFSFKEIKNEKG